MEFEWDADKNATNVRKHGIGFEEATRVFLDPLRLSVLDRVVDGEARWQTIGTSNGLVLLVVAHTLRENDNDDEIIRIISARKAEPVERRAYASGKDR